MSVIYVSIFTCINSIACVSVMANRVSQKFQPLNTNSRELARKLSSLTTGQMMQSDESPTNVMWLWCSNILTMTYEPGTLSLQSELTSLFWIERKFFKNQRSPTNFILFCFILFRTYINCQGWVKVVWGPKCRDEFNSFNKKKKSITETKPNNKIQETKKTWDVRGKQTPEEPSNNKKPTMRNFTGGVYIWGTEQRLG